MQFKLHTSLVPPSDQKHLLSFFLRWTKISFSKISIPCFSNDGCCPVRSICWPRATLSSLFSNKSSICSTSPLFATPSCKKPALNFFAEVPRVPQNKNCSCVTYSHAAKSSKLSFPWRDTTKDTFKLKHCHASSATNASIFPSTWKSINTHIPALSRTVAIAAHYRSDSEVNWVFTRGQFIEIDCKKSQLLYYPLYTY